jgi:hypothetical protein
MTRQILSPNTIGPSRTGAFWKSDIDALIFPIEAHSSSCAVHRRAFRTLLKSDPTPQACLSYFADREYAFKAAAHGKITQKGIPAGRNFHLTSRDVARKLLELKQKESGERCGEQ